MMWLEQMGTSRALEPTGWLGAALVAKSWRLPVAALAAAVRRRRADRGGPRVPPVSSAWLRQHEVDCMKREHAR